jgi:hypothetical protein
VAYADDAAPSAREVAFRGWFYVAPSTTTVAPDRECAADRSAEDCARCFEDSARAATATVGWLQRLRGDDVAVVGYSCCLRVRVSGWQWPSSRDRKFPSSHCLANLFFSAFAKTRIGILIEACNSNSTWAFSRRFSCTCYACRDND